MRYINYFYLEINNTYLITFSYFEFLREDAGGVCSIGARAVLWNQDVFVDMENLKCRYFFMADDNWFFRKM